MNPEGLCKNRVQDRSGRVSCVFAHPAESLDPLALEVYRDQQASFGTSGVESCELALIRNDLDHIDEHTVGVRRDEVALPEVLTTQLQVDR